MSRSLITRTAGASLLACVGLSGVASAHAGDRSFEQTYPRATALCARAAAGRLPKRLAPQTSQVQAACQTLRGGFAPLQATVQAAEAKYLSDVAAVRATMRSACAMRGPDCRSARIQGRAQIRNLRAQRRLAVRTYYIGLEANRRTFWATIRSLRGGRQIMPDRPVPVQSS